MKFFVKTRLSENISETPEGFLLCRNVPLTHTGALRYVHPEHPFGEDHPEVTIKRSPEELFSNATMASFEGKDITIQHPDEFVGPENYQELTHGVMFNIRKGSEQIEVDQEKVEPLLGDFLIKSSEAIKMVKAGEREVSLGYEAAWELINDEEGRHSKIRGNHCAIVSEGRAGIHCAITDHKKENDLMGKEALEKFKKLFGKTVDEAMKEKEDSEQAKKFKKLFGKTIDEAMEEKSEDEEEEKEKEDKKSKDEEKEEKPKDKSKDEEGSDLEKRMDKVEAMLSKLLEKLDGSKSEDEEESEESEDEDESEVVSEDEESEDEMCEDEGSEEEVKKEKAGDTMSRAEILAPGIKKSKDIMSKALAKAYKTKDGKKVINTLTGGKDPSTLPKSGVRAVFVSAAEMLKTKRVNDFASQRITTIDSFPALKGNSVKSAADINKMNAEFYGNKK